MSMELGRPECNEQFRQQMHALPDVVGFQVAVNDAPLVQMSQSSQDAVNHLAS